MNYTFVTIKTATAFIAISLCAAAAHAQEKQITFTEKYRPQYHFSLPDGRIGDPTGMIFYNNEYYLNYGLGRTPDFVHWDFGKPEFRHQDGIGMMSGSAIVDRNNTSGFGTLDHPPIVAVYSELRHSDIMQFQSLSYSTDGGRTFTPYSGNPVLDINNTEFRDPMVFWHEPTKKWIMAVAMAADTKVRFYGSPNLKEWSFLSDFGPYGARGGVWECPDLFPLPVNGDPGNIKWVLQVGVQPVSGQYFVGDFNGREFLIDPAYEKQSEYKKYMPSGQVLFDFEGGMEGWKMEGDAFTSSPATSHFENQSAILNKEGNRFVNSFHNKDAGKGRALSPEFTVTAGFINFLIGGGNHPARESINLIVGDKTVRSSTGLNTETLTWTGWDVKEYKGKKARIEIVDAFEGGFGHILADHFMQGDELAVRKLEKGPWIDFGPDFYAVRSWVNMRPGDDRRVWLAWMSSWLYTSELPTKPFHGIQSLPRSLSLRYDSGKYQLLQSPVEELKQLRGAHHELPQIEVSGTKILPQVRPSANSYELIVEIETGSGERAGFNLCVGKDQKTTVYYDTATNELVLDRSSSGLTDFSPSFSGIYRAPLALVDNKVKLHIFVDQSAIEIFGNDGTVSLSALIFPDPLSTGIEAFVQGGKAKIMKFNLWELKSIWVEGK